MDIPILKQGYITVSQFAIRRKGTQEYLPKSQRRDGRGGSHLEPMDFSLPPGQRGEKSRYAQNMMVRTWTTRAAAMNCLNAWVAGKFYGDYEGDTWVRTVPERRKIDMEIVEVHLLLPF